MIPWLRRLKFGQQILEDGPKWHEKKAGTPTMGGFIFIAGVIVAAIVALLIKFDVHLMMMLLIAVGFSAIGFVDDYVKVIKKAEPGIDRTAEVYFAGDFVGYIYCCHEHTGDLNTEIIIPFAHTSWSMPWWLYIVFTFDCCYRNR